jgi:hypothetical protein
MDINPISSMIDETAAISKGKSAKNSVCKNQKVIAKRFLLDQCEHLNCPLALSNCVPTPKITQLLAQRYDWPHTRNITFM